MNRELPIGVFDSGLGGLTVVQRLRGLLPDESIIYLGDTARVPYGTRSPETVIRYARACSRVLVERGIKALVIACNTASSVALELLRAELDVPVIGVIGPGAAAAVAAAERLEKTTGAPVTIGVLGTASTVASGAYPSEVNKLSTRVDVSTQAAPLLVPLVEEGWLDGPVPTLALERYLQPLVSQGAGVLVLGCTHYPLLSGLIQEVAERLAGNAVSIVDSAEATASALAELLQSRKLTAVVPTGRLQLLVTDMPKSFESSAARFLAAAVAHAEQVDLAPA